MKFTTQSIDKNWGLGFKIVKGHQKSNFVRIFVNALDSSPARNRSVDCEHELVCMCVLAEVRGSCIVV